MNCSAFLDSTFTNHKRNRLPKFAIPQKIRLTDQSEFHYD